MHKKLIDITYRAARRIVVGVIGTTVVLAGVALLFLPGPAFVVIPAGIAILSLEFAWARTWLHHIRDRSKAAMEMVRNSTEPKEKKAEGSS